MSNKTKAGIEVKPGQVWRDLDKRTNRRVKVLRLGDGKHEGKVRTRSFVTDHLGDHWVGQETWISISRMHNHSTGFELEEA